MSRKKLTIIVTCTDRKSATPGDDLMARNLPQGEAPVRAEAWNRALDRPRQMTPLVDLYRGETWSQVKRLLVTARDLDYDPEVVVASAGLGIRRIDDRAPSYAATFSSGHEDSVAASTDEAITWWSALPRTTAKCGAGRSLWVLSESYSRVIGPEMVRDHAGDELIVFGGSSEIPSDVRIPSDRSLRRALGGTVTSLNVRMAIQWLVLSRNSDPFGPRASVAWRDWAERAQHREEYGRKPVSDDVVLEFVADLARRQPGVSKTVALRALRDSGLACEQRRFSLLFQKAAAR